MENLFNINYLLGLIATPFGLATLGVLLTAFFVEKVTSRTWKVIISWAVGIALSVGMLLLGKYANFGTYAVFEFSTWQDWTAFILVALSPGLISNGIYDSKVLQWLLNLIGK